MGEVVSLDEARPHLAGLARCTACGHEWAQVAPVGAVWFECPACGSERGLYRHPVSELEGATHRWECPCGCDAFAISLFDGMVVATCTRCGEASYPWG